MKFTSKKENNSFIASVLKSVGRLSVNEVNAWGSDLLEIALKNEDIEVRDAAIQALELWGTNSAVELLKSHNEIIPWLKDYISKVIRDLE